MSSFQKNCEVYTHTHTKCGSFVGGKKEKLVETVLEKAQVLDLLDKDFQINCLKYDEKDKGLHRHRAKEN